MRDVDSCLDAFKHLPYFKPLYTTILRQQMQFLTEQLSLHAGEESLVLTTNISAGTISSLTSTFGTGFLDHRTELKKEFSTHCAKNKLTYDCLKYENKRISHTDNLHVEDQPNMAVKRKRSEIEKNHRSVKIPDMDNNLETKDTDKSYVINKVNKQTVKGSCSVKNLPDVPSHIGDLANIEIENVRSLKPEKNSASECDRFSKKLPEETHAADERDQRSTLIIKEELDDDDDADCFVVKESTKENLDTDLPTSNETLDEEDNILLGSDSQILRDGFKENGNLGGVMDGQISMETANNVTDDMISVRESYITDTEPVSMPEKIVTETDDIITVQKSYLSSSDENSLPGKLSTETDGNDMWIVAGVSSEGSLIEMSDTTENDINIFNKQATELSSETGIDKCFESVINQNFPSPRSSGFLSNVNIAQEYKKGVQFIGKRLTPTAQVRRSTDESRAHYKCNFCPQSFTSYSSQKRHERRHTGETPWSCEFCDKRFYRKDDLHVHSLKHVGQKPYMCPICQAGYCKKKLLDLHVAAHMESSESLPDTCSND